VDTDSEVQISTAPTMTIVECPHPEPLGLSGQPLIASTTFSELRETLTIMFTAIVAYLLNHIALLGLYDGVMALRCNEILIIHVIHKTSMIALLPNKPSSLLSSIVYISHFTLPEHMLTFQKLL